MRAAKNILITGAAKRIGAACVRLLHAEGHNIILHYHTSAHAASALVKELNALRPDSVVMFAADLLQRDALRQLAERALKQWGGVDVLVNNAALFFPETVADTTAQSWDALMGSNLAAPFWLAQALESSLRARQGCIVNIVDIHSERGLLGYPV